MNTAELLARARLLNRDLAPGEPLAETVPRPLTAALAGAEPEVTEDGTPAARLAGEPVGFADHIKPLWIANR